MMVSTEETYETEISLLFEDAISKLDKIDIQANKEKKQIVIELAKGLEGKIPTDTISIEIVNQLRGRVSERFIHNCLEMKYKQKHRVENARKQKKKGAVEVENLAVVGPLNQEDKSNVVVNRREETELPHASEILVSRIGSSSGDGATCTPELKTENKECDRCKIREYKIAELEGKVQNYEQIIEDLPIKTADQITLEAIKAVENSNTIHNEIVDCEYSISWPEMQRYVQHIYASGKPLLAWFNFQFDKHTGNVIAVYLGRIAERSIMNEEFNQQNDRH